MKKTLLAALAGLALIGGACRDYDDRPAQVPTTEPGVGGAGYDRDGDGKRLGDGKIGRENGVIDDGEGPLEGDGVADDKIGDRPGVWNDGEGPLEENPETDRPESR